MVSWDRLLLILQPSKLAQFSWEFSIQALEYTIKRVPALAYLRLEYCARAPPVDRPLPYMLQLATDQLTAVYLKPGAAEMDYPIIPHLMGLRRLRKLRVTQQVSGSLSWTESRIKVDKLWHA
jgi:hypothetical protein